ncbi:UbiA family prenyltransferase [Cellulomonas soli]
MHRRILVACVVATVPFVVWLLAVGSALAGVVLVGVLFLVVAYSAPVLRFKERPVLDSATSAMHFVGPLLYALVLVGADLGDRHVWPVLVAFVLWGMASHAFGAVQDVRADREGASRRWPRHSARTPRWWPPRWPTAWRCSRCSPCRGRGRSPRSCRSRTR